MKRIIHTSSLAFMNSDLLKGFLPVLFLLVSVVGMGQELARFDFNGKNLNTTGGYNANYLLRFYNSNGTNGTAQFDRPGFWTGNYWTYTKQENAYYELSLNTGAYEGIQISFDGELSYTAYSTATWSVYVDYGDGNGYGTTPIGTLALENDFILGMSDSGSFTINFPAAANFNSNWKVKFVAHNFWDILDNNPQLRMDNLVISSNSAKIAAEGRDTSNNWANIIEGSSAETFRGTYFGMVITNPETGPDYVERNFKIKNAGNQALNVTGVHFTGDAASDFTITSGIPVTVPANGGERQFTVRFNPSEDGVRNALLNISSNANPSPFTFFVEGRGASCAADIDAFRWFTFGDNLNGVSDNLPIQSGTPAIISGNRKQNQHTPFDTNIIYRNNSNNNNSDAFNLFTSSNHAWYLNGNTDKIVTFGPIPVSSEKGVEISFRLAAVSRDSGQQFGNNDYITLEVLKPGTSNDWSQEIRIIGGGNNANNSRYSFDQGTTLTRTYAGTGSVNYVNNESNTQSTKYNKIVLKIPSTEDFSTLTFRINGKTNNANKLWLIDDILVSSESTIFKTYTASGWQMNGSPTSAPNKQEKAVIDADLTVTSANPLVTCECEVNAGKSLTIEQDGVVTITGKLINNGDVTIESDANLIQIEDEAENIGSLKAERYVFGVENVFPNNMDYIYWSSPVSGQQLKAFSPGTPNNRFYYYNESDDYFYPSNPLLDFVPGMGYAIRAEDGYTSGYEKTYEFFGSPNNGVIDGVNLKKEGDGYNLVGNPYPSNIDFDELFELNQNKIYKIAFFWTNNGENNQYQSGSDYDGNNYAVYNATGGNPATEFDNGFDITSSIVKVGQGFIVQAKDAGHNQPLVFNNVVRVSTPGAFYQKNGEEKDRFWLTLKSPSEVYNTMLIGYVPGATDGFELDFDAPLLAEGADAIYSMFEDQKLAIQGFEPPMHIADVIPLGVKFFEDGIYSIEVRRKEGVFAEKKIFLKDKLLNITHNLSAAPYQFEARVGEVKDRFEIVFKNDSFSTTASVAYANQVNILKEDNQILVKSTNEKILQIELFNLAGWSIYKKSDVNNKEIRIPVHSLGKQIVIVTVQTESGEIVNKKFILN